MEEPSIGRPLPTLSTPEPLAAPGRPASWPWQSILLVLGTVALTVGLFLVPSSVIAQLGAYGYVGVFLLTLLASASIVLPSPAVAIALVAGQTLDPWLVGLVAGVAAGLGEITGYMAGRGGSGLAQRSQFYPRIEAWVRRWGALTIFVMALIPSPAFDLAGIAAGAMRMPFQRFLLVCMAGKILRFILVAWVGRYFGNLQLT